MSVKSKTQLHADVAALPSPITATSLTTIIDDIIDSYEDVIQQLDQTAIDALTPTEGLIVYNTTTNRLQAFNDAYWLPLSNGDIIGLSATGNPNYPAALVGDQYIITAAGKVGGAGGKYVFVGDIIFCATSNAGGNEATVGGDWYICRSGGSAYTQTYLSEVSLSSADILDLHDTPITLVSAQGSGTMIVPQTIITIYSYLTADYATNTSIRAGMDDNEDFELIDLASLGGNLTTVKSFDIGHDLLENKSLYAIAHIGNPTAGSGTMKIKVYYKVIKI